MIRLVCIVEIESATTVEQAQAKLDAFREATQPSAEYGIFLYRASEREADAGIYGGADAEAENDAAEVEPAAAASEAPAVMTEHELRAWLRSLGLTRVRLPRTLDRVTYVVQPDGGIWMIKALITGAFTVAPYRSEQKERRP